MSKITFFRPKEPKENHFEGTAKTKPFYIALPFFFLKPPLNSKYKLCKAWVAFKCKKDNAYYNEIVLIFARYCLEIIIYTARFLCIYKTFPSIPASYLVIPTQSAFRFFPPHCRWVIHQNMLAHDVRLHLCFIHPAAVV